MGKHRKHEVIIKRIREIHYPGSTNGKTWMCYHCDAYWPCETGEVVYSGNEIEYQLTHSPNLREFREQNTIQSQEAYPTKSIPFGGGFT